MGATPRRRRFKDHWGGGTFPDLSLLMENNHYGAVFPTRVIAPPPLFLFKRFCGRERVYGGNASTVYRILFKEVFAELDGEKK